MKESEIVLKINQALAAAKSSLSTAEKWSQVLAEKQGVSLDGIDEKTKKLSPMTLDDDDLKIVNGIFDGQNMIGSDKKTYPVPANYASKSKLVEGDTLKLTIQPNGAFIYKQIEQAPRQLITGHLILDGSQYKVLGDDQQTYNVLYASVTFYRATVGDRVTVIVPEGEKAHWGAIENVLPAETPVKAEKEK